MTRHLRAGWNAFRMNSRVLTLAMLILFASWVLLEVSVITLHSGGPLVNIALHLAFLMLFSGLLAGFHLMAILAARGEALQVRCLFLRMHRGPQFLLAWSIYSVAVVLGMAMLVLPGVYLAVRFGLFGFVIAEQDVSALGALGAAGTLTEERWSAALGLAFTLVAMNLLGAALLGVGLVVSVPVSLIACADYARWRAAAQERAA